MELKLLMENQRKECLVRFDLIDEIDRLGLVLQKALAQREIDSALYSKSINLLDDLRKGFLTSIHDSMAARESVDNDLGLKNPNKSG